MRTTIAVLNKRGENAAEIIVATMQKMYPTNKMCFRLATPSKLVANKKSEDIEALKLVSPIAIGSAASNAATFHGTNMYKIDNATLVFDGRIYAPTPKHFDLDVFNAKTQADCAEASKAFLQSVEGDFSLLIATTKAILAIRDPCGVQPLYYGENTALSGLASCKKALWELGIEEPKSFPPGNLATVTCDGFRFEQVKTLQYTKPKENNMEKAAATLQKLLECSVQMRVSGQKEIAVAFSGGLDSSVVACLAKRMGVDVYLIHVSLEGQLETDEAKKAAAFLDLPLKVHLFTMADVEKTVLKVVELIEEPEPIKVGVGLPFYWIAQKASEAGLHVMLAGQGADELFGGYKRYIKEYLEEGNEKVRQTMFNDVTVIHESNIERDEKICNFHNVELRLPFASFQVAEFAMSLQTKLKFEMKQDSLRKLVLRRTAKNLGLPREIVEKPKKAVQYSTGTSSALKKLAKKHDLPLSNYVNELFLEAKNQVFKNE